MMLPFASTRSPKAIANIKLVSTRVIKAFADRPICYLLPYKQIERSVFLFFFEFISLLASSCWPGLVCSTGRFSNLELIGQAGFPFFPRSGISNRFFTSRDDFRTAFQHRS